MKLDLGMLTTAQRTKMRERIEGALSTERLEPGDRVDFWRWAITVLERGEADIPEPDTAARARAWSEEAGEFAMLIRQVAPLNAALYNRVFTLSSDLARQKYGLQSGIGELVREDDEERG